jgi:hypothetical protein
MEGGSFVAGIGFADARADEIGHGLRRLSSGTILQSEHVAGVVETRQLALAVSKEATGPRDTVDNLEPCPGRVAFAIDRLIFAKMPETPADIQFIL